MKSSFKYIFAGILLGLGIFGGNAFSQTIKFNSIKPTASSQTLTDEQQGILAVRLAKASVVNIVGASKPLQPSADLTITVPSSSVSATGFVLDSSGLIITNDHVVDDPSLNYWVFLADGTKYPAKVESEDKYDDVALIRVDASLTPATLGDSDALETGQTVFAIGNSLGKYQDSVTKGVVSGLGRSVDNVQSDEPRVPNLIQTDAAISLGNSGGPLVDLSGEVVGMDTLMDTGGDSLGFAIPINVIKDVIKQIKLFGKVSRPFLGVQFSTIDPAIQAENNLPVSDGAYIIAVSTNGPADAGGLKAYDIITAVNGQNVNLANQLDTILQKLQAGNQITLKVLRDGQTLNLNIILGEFK